MMHYHDGPLMISPEICALTTLADLGHSDYTYTGFKHKLVACLLDCYSEKEAQQFYKNGREKVLKRLK